MQPRSLPLDRFRIASLNFKDDTILLLTVCIILVALTAIVRLAAGPIIVDDAYITFRYAANLAAGHGFVYNLGEQVLGTSTPLLSFILALLAELGLRPEFASITLSLISDASLIVVFALLGRELKHPTAGILAALWISVDPLIVGASLSGMETEFYTALIMWSGFAFVRHRIRWAVLLGCLVALTRPEGGLLLFALALVVLWRQEWEWQAWLPAGAILAGWAVFSFLYFGSIVPQSVIAKMVIYPAAPQPWHDLLEIVTALVLPFSLLPNVLWMLFAPPAIIITVVFSAGVILLCGVGIYEAMTTRASPLVVWLLLDLTFFSVANRLLFPWYAVPIRGIFFLLVFMGAGKLIMQSNHRMQRWLNVSAFSAVAATSLLLAFLLTSHLQSERQVLSEREPFYACVASVLARSLPADSIVAAPEIGVIGYNFPGYILDLSGLVTPRAIPYYGQVTYRESMVWPFPVDLVQAEQPDAIITFTAFSEGLNSSKWFNKHYRTTFYIPSLHPAFGSLALFVRNDVTVPDTSSCLRPH